MRDFTKKPCKIFEIFLVQDTIQWLNYVLHYLNVKINWKLADKINAQFWSALKWERVLKSGRLGMDQVSRWEKWGRLPRPIHPIVTITKTKMKLLCWQSTPEGMMPNLAYSWKVPPFQYHPSLGTLSFPTPLWHAHSVYSLLILQDRLTIRGITSL